MLLFSGQPGCPGAETRSHNCAHRIAVFSDIARPFAVTKPVDYRQPVIIARPRKIQQLALTDKTQLITALNHHLAFLHTQ